jgi:hypothetical protein
MVIIKATISDEPSRVAGAEVTQLHTLSSSKFHDAGDGSHVLKMDAFGGEKEEDISLIVATNNNELIVKCGSAARTHITLPEDADVAGIYGELAAGSLDIHVPKK